MALVTHCDNTTSYHTLINNTLVEGLDSDTYHAIDRASSHRLGLLKKSPAHLRYELDHPKGPTPAMVFGSAVHCAVLEPDTFEDIYARQPKIDARTKEGKAARDKFISDNAFRIILSDEDYDAVKLIAANVMSHPLASKLIKATTNIEMSGFWIDKDTGVECKLRADAICGNHGTIFDLKTTQDASPENFEKSVYNFGYYRQGAFYIDGLKALGVDISNYAIIAVEKDAPYSVAVYRLKNDAIELGRRENRELLQLYAKCLKENDWPAYPNFIVDIGLPAWATRQIERSLTNE